MKRFKFSIHGNHYDVEIQQIEDEQATVSVNGQLYEVEIDKSMQLVKTPKLVRTQAIPSTDVSAATARTSSPAAPKGGGTIKSPLPGTILNLHVKVGDAVKMGQKLITLEAMKMENNIDADKEGVIMEIKVSKGDAVMEGDVLIVIG